MKAIDKILKPLQILFLLIAVFTFTAEAFDIVTPLTTNDGLMFGTMAAIGNVTQPSDRETAPNQIGFKLWLTAREQIDTSTTFPSPDANRNLGTIPLLSGEFMHFFEGIEDTIKYLGSGEKGELTSTFNKEIPIAIRYSDKTLTFCEEYLGKGFTLIYQECESEKKMVVGSYCKPMTLKKFEVKEDSDGKYIQLTFGNTHWRQPLNYTGDIVTQDPVAVSAGSTELAVQSDNNIYQLSDHTAQVTIATLSGVASADHGRFITLKAPGVASHPPKISDNAVYVLKGGTDWVANPGSQIEFEIFDDDTLIERSRTQTA